MAKRGFGLVMHQIRNRYRACITPIGRIVFLCGAVRSRVLYARGDTVALQTDCLAEPIITVGFRLYANSERVISPVDVVSPPLRKAPLGFELCPGGYRVIIIRQ